MKLKALILENFRCYQGRVRIEFDDLTALVGRNDAGKSAVLEALEIFFNSEQVKLDRSDRCVYSQADTIRIGCIFADIPDALIIDARASTSLRDEYLLNSDGDFEVHKCFDCSTKTPKETVIAVAQHPVGTDVEGLLLCKNDELKALLRKLQVDEKGIDLRSNVQVRRAIRNAKEPLTLEGIEIPLDKEDAKKVWDQLKSHLPLFALFRSDRASQDGDEEVQNPLKVAVSQAIKEHESELQKIEEAVRARTDDVAQRTLGKLREMDAQLAAELRSDFKADRKWDSLFKFTLSSDDHIPINKRGSGVRRLILLNFFRAEAERRQVEKKAPSVIYAVEEPETSQHPHNQRMLVEAFSDLADQDKAQVILTTHTPGLAGMIPREGLRFVQRAVDKTVSVTRGSEDVFLKIAHELGVSPDRRVRVLIMVEGPNDVTFLRNVSAILNGTDASLINLLEDPRIAMIPLGGSTLKQWVEQHYLKGIGLPEVHMYDRGTDNPPQYESACRTVNERNDGSWAVLTRKQEIENYLHADAIKEALGVAVTFGVADDVPLICAKAVHEAAADSKPWEEVDEETQKLKMKNVKIRLNRDATAKMTGERLKQSDPDKEIEGWIRKIGEMLA